MNRPDIEAIEKRAELAMPGPWGATTRRGSWDWLIYLQETPNMEVCQMLHDGTDLNLTGEGNADFIAHARTDIPSLLAYIEELEKKQ